MHSPLSLSLPPSLPCPHPSSSSVHMATLLESLTVPSFSAFPTPKTSPITCRSVRLPEPRGLKLLSLSFSTRSPTPIQSRSCRGRIVCEAQETAVEVPAVSDATWESRILQSDSPVLVEFWAPWCGPCRMIHPVIDELAKQYVGKLKCYKVNTDENPNIATQYGIKSIPTVMIFKNGEKKDAVIGAVPKTTLTGSIEKFL